MHVFGSCDFKIIWFSRKESFTNIHQLCSQFPSKHAALPNAGSMLVPRLWRWPSIGQIAGVCWIDVLTCNHPVTLIVFSATVDDHFAKSLGDTWTKIKKDSTSGPEVPGSVDDHFAKALGDTWYKIKAEQEHGCRSNGGGGSPPGSSPGGRPSLTAPTVGSV